MRDSTNTGTYEINATIYRCSSNLDFRVSDNSIPTTFNVGSGGIAGFNNFGCNLYVYDCYALMRQTFVVSKAIAGFYSGAMVALSVIGKDQSMGGMTNFSNCVGKVVNDLTQAKNGLWFHGGITTFYENAGANVATTSSIENIFISGTSYGANAGTYKLWPWLARRSSGDNTTNGRGILKSTGEIFYTGEDSSAGVWNITTSGRYRGTMASGSNNGTLVGTATGNGDAQLWTKAKESTVLKSKIWSQKDNIGGAYSIQNSPVINKFESSPFTFNLKDAKSDGTDTILKTDTYNYGSTPGLTSQTSQTGKTFLGYTFDRTSTANPFKTLPIVSGSSYYGNMDLYAVWDVPDADVTKDISVSGGVEENGTIVADYGEVIMLTADIACAAMGSDITLEYDIVKEYGDGFKAYVNDNGNYNRIKYVFTKEMVCDLADYVTSDLEEEFLKAATFGECSMILVFDKETNTFQGAKLQLNYDFNFKDEANKEAFSLKINTSASIENCEKVDMPSNFDDYKEIKDISQEDIDKILEGITY